MNKITTSILGLAVLLAAGCGKTVNVNKAPKSSLDSFSYVVGLNLGKGLKGQGLDKIDYSSLLHGIEDALKKDSGYAIAEKDWEKAQRGYMMREQEKKIKVYQAETKKYMDANAKKAGVSYLPSRGQFRQISAGNGASPGQWDTVECYFKVTNAKGKVVFDGRKNPMPYRGTLSGLALPPLEEAFQKSAAGAKFEVTIANDAYPALSRNAGSFEDMYGISIFDVEFLKVTPGKQPPPSKEKPGMPQIPNMPQE
ncbi:MAG: hypothetical protein JNL57_13540 [Bacteroidetes bacterium]|nr:hypothetical protein [Bacteroidota bacterium]